MIDSFNKYVIDPEVKAVLVGLDSNFTYTSLALASLYINNGKCKFICTNEQKQITLGNGMKYPGAGSIVEGIQITLNNEEGSQRTERPEIAGKPNGFAM